MFERMKQTAVFVNTSRGGVVDQEALYDALSNGYVYRDGYQSDQTVQLQLLVLM